MGVGQQQPVVGEDHRRACSADVAPVPPAAGNLYGCYPGGQLLGHRHDDLGDVPNGVKAVWGVCERVSLTVRLLTTKIGRPRSLNKRKGRILPAWRRSRGRGEEDLGTVWSVVMADRSEVRTASWPVAAVDVAGLASNMLGAIARLPFRYPWRGPVLSTRNPAGLVDMAYQSPSLLGTHQCHPPADIHDSPGSDPMALT